MKITTSTPSFPSGHRSGPRAFTLIEMLTVISIIGIVAGLLLTASSGASNSSKKRMVEAQRDELQTYIESYFAAKGFYPPDSSINATNVVVSGINIPINTNTPLFYELSGTTNSNGKFYPPVGDPINATTLQNVFGMGGFINSITPGGDAGEQSMKTFLKGLKDNQKVTVTVGAQTYVLLCADVINPYSTPPARPAVWNYLAAPHAKNNTATFDLWVDIKLGNKTFRISNWSKQPQPLN